MKFDGFGSWEWISAEPISLGMEKFKRMGYETIGFLSKAWRLWRGKSMRKIFFSSLPNGIEVERCMKKIEESISPIFFRLDLVVDEEWKFWLVEIELQPAGWGILQRMQEVYGISPTVGEITAELMKNEEIVYSMPGYKESRSEAEYFVKQVNNFGGRMMFLPIEDWEKENWGKQDIIFKNCCTLDLITKDYPLFIPNAKFTPPLELDWKGWLAMAMSPPLNRQPLASYIPETYILPLIPGKQTEQRKILLDASREERREWIIKPSASWGAKGFIGGPLNTREWNEIILGMGTSGNLGRGYILQRKILSRHFSVSINNGEKLDGLSARVSPFYVSWKGKVEFVGALITLRKSLKVHGASDAVMTIVF